MHYILLHVSAIIKLRQLNILDGLKADLYLLYFVATAI